jgi:hypothetical protein
VNGSNLASGRPVSAFRDQNPFAALAPIESPYVQQSVAALRSAKILIQADPVIDAPMTPIVIADHLTNFAAGTRFMAVT